MKCSPTVSALLVSDEEPVLSSVLVPRMAVPSRKVTVPCGTTVEPESATAARNVTASPKCEGFKEERRVVIVASPSTWSGTVAELVPNWVVGLKVAVAVYVPAPSWLVEMAATPFTSGAVPRVVVPAANVTVPVT